MDTYALIKTMGIRLPKKELDEGGEINFDFSDLETTEAILAMIYRAWRYFSKGAGGTIHFRVEELKGIVERRGHRPRGGDVWYEPVWAGNFKLRINFSDAASVPSPLIVAFLRALAEGMVTLGGGQSIGRGFVEIKNVEEVVAAINALSRPQPPSPASSSQTKKGFLRRLVELVWRWLRH